MRSLEKPIDILLLKEADEYIDELPERIRIKILKSFDKTKLGLKGHWFKNIGDGVWEFRERDSQKFYRLLAFWNSSEESETLIIARHGFDKKTNKTPVSQKSKVIRIRNKYFENK